MKIFVGSSTESLDDLLEVSSWIEDEGTTIIPWNKPELFLPGQNTISRLNEIAKEVDAAIFIFGEDDTVWYRSDGLKQPRDNVLLEYGLFSALLGTENAVICRKDSSKTPSDLTGIVVVDISDRNKNTAQKKLIAWAKGRKLAILKHHPVSINKGLVVLIPKATTGFTKELTEAIGKEVTTHLPNLSLTILQPSIAEQIQQGDFIDAMSMHPEVIMITPPPDSDYLIPHVISALKMGIPVITIDDQLDPKPFIENGLIPPVNIACDYADGGKKAAEVILKELKYKGRIAIISGPTTSYSSQIRKFAFIDKILSASPNTSLISVKETNWNPNVGEQKMKEILKEVDSLDAIFCCNDRLALKALTVIKESGLFEDHFPIIVGHDGTKEAIEAIKKCEIFATISQHMDQLAKLAVDELRKASENRIEYIKKHNFLIQLKTSILMYEDVM